MTTPAASTALLPPLPDLAALPAMAVAAHVDRLHGNLDDAGCDTLLVTHLVNIRYLTGFTGSAALLLVTPDELVFVTDGRYGEQATDQLSIAGVTARIEVSSTGQKDVLQAAVGTGATIIGRLGAEAEHVSWAQQQRFADEWFPAVELIPTTGLVEDLRIVKDEGEVARIEAAALVADHTLAAVRPMLGERPPERDFALALDGEIRRLGAAGNSFETIVASGPNGARPHARPSDRRIERGDLVVIDFGALVDGYCSDMTRTVMVGEPTPAQQRMLEVVTAAQQAGVDAVRAGAAAKDVDGVCRAVIDDAGWADAFLHGTGHGVGLDIHEQPRVSSAGDAILAEGYVVTVEPGVYLPEHGGVRVEDTVVVTAEGCRALTHTSKATAVI